MTILPFAVAFPLVWLIFHAYVGWRAAGVPLVARLLPGRRLFHVLLATATTYPLARLLETAGADLPGRVLEFAGLSWLGFLFLACFCLGVVDLATGFGRFAPRLAPRLRGVALVAAAVLAAMAQVQGLRAPVVEDYEVRLPGLPRALDGTVMVVMSDLHLGRMIRPDWLDRVVAQVEALHPDLVITVGDVIDGGVPLKDDRPFLPGLARLTAPLGVWSVTGNHEAHSGVEASTRFFREAGFHVLRDEWAEVAPGLVIAGIADLHPHGPAPDAGERIEHALAGRPAGVATIFLSHRPREAEVAARAGAGLMLSGHTHGGQIWPFEYVARLSHPLLDGRYDVDGMTVLVSRGAGTWGPRMRLFKRGTILRVTLRAP